MEPTHQKDIEKLQYQNLAKISKLKLKPEPDMQFSLQSKFPVANASGVFAKLGIGNWKDCKRH